MGKNSGSRSRIRISDEKPGSYFRELRNHFFGLLLKFFDADLGSQLQYSPYFAPAAFLPLPESEIRAGKLLVDPGHLQEELVGGCPHHRYRRACCRCPRLDRVLQKTHLLLMTMPKNYLKQVSL